MSSGTVGFSSQLLTSPLLAGETPSADPVPELFDPSLLVAATDSSSSLLLSDTPEEQRLSLEEAHFVSFEGAPNIYSFSSAHYLGQHVLFVASEGQVHAIHVADDTAASSSSALLVAEVQWTKTALPLQLARQLHAASTQGNVSILALDVMVDAATGQLQLGVAILQDEMPFLTIHTCALKPCHLLSSDDIQKQTFSLDYIPFVLTHVRLTAPKPLRTSGSNSRRGSFTNVSSQQQPSPQEEGTTDAFLLSGSDNEIYAFVKKHTNEQGADMFVSQLAQDILPELANQELNSPVMCFDIYQGTWGRIVAGGCQDGKLFVHATLPANGAESEEEKLKKQRKLSGLSHSSSLQRVFHYKRLWDGPITSVRLFFSLDDRKTATEEDDPSSVGLVLSPNPSKKDAEALHVHPFFRSLHQRVNQFLSFEDIDDDSSAPPEYTQVHLLVTSAIGPSMVYHHVALNGLYSETISVLPLSGDHDSVLCSQVAVLDWNNPFSCSPLLLLGTYGQELLVYRFHCTGNEASEEERGYSKYALMWKRSFSNAIYGLDCADLTRDGMMEVAVRSGDGVHVLQHDPALACQRILSRLSLLKGLIDLQERFHHDLLS